MQKLQEIKQRQSRKIDMFAMKINICKFILLFPLKKLKLKQENDVTI